MKKRIPASKDPSWIATSPHCSPTFLLCFALRAHSHLALCLLFHALGCGKTRCASVCYSLTTHKRSKDKYGTIWDRTVQVAWQIGLSNTIRTTYGIKVPIVQTQIGRPIGRVGEKKGWEGGKVFNCYYDRSSCSKGFFHCKGIAVKKLLRIAERASQHSSIILAGKDTLLRTIQ